MKISSSMVQMTSDHNCLEQDRITLEIKGAGGLSDRSAAWSSGIADRVSLESYYREETRSTYAAALASESSVRDDGAETQFMAQRLVSAVAGREVSLAGAAGIRADASESGNGLSAGLASGIGDAQAWIRETRIHSEQEEVGFSTRGEVRTADGRTIDFTMDLSMERSLFSQITQESQIQAALTDPLVVSLDGMPPRLTDTRFEFDLDMDGVMDEISFVARGSGFLAFDRNEDGKINDGSELFGPASGDGFQDLSIFDGDGNGWIDENDEVFSQLSVWTRDAGGKDILVSLKDAGLGAIFLGSAATPFDLRGEESGMLGRVAASGVFLYENGEVGMIQEIDLAVGLAESQAPGTASPLPGGGGAAAPAFSDAGAVSENPFDTLKSSIEALREKLRQLLENRSIAGRQIQGSLYNASTPDRASFLMPKGSMASRRTSIMSSSPVTSKI